MDPFLCLAALVVLVDWPEHLGADEPTIFAMAGILVALLAACMALMGLVLWAYRVSRDRWSRGSAGMAGYSRYRRPANRDACPKLVLSREAIQSSDAQARSRDPFVRTLTRSVCRLRGADAGPLRRDRSVATAVWRRSICAPGPRSISALEIEWLGRQRHQRRGRATAACCITTSRGGLPIIWC